MTFPLGRRLKAIRALYGIEQTVLANEAGIERPRLSDFENGKILLPDENIRVLGEILKAKGVVSSHTIEFPIPEADLALAA